MYVPPRNTPEHWQAVTAPRLSALVGFALATVLVPLAVTVLASQPTLVSVLLLGSGLTYLLSRTNGLKAHTRKQLDRRRNGDIPVWFEGLGRRPQPVPQYRSE